VAIDKGKAWCRLPAVIDDDVEIPPEGTLLWVNDKPNGYGSELAKSTGKKDGSMLLVDNGRSVRAVKYWSYVY